MYTRPEIVVLPVAGLSTRNLPATKAMHKGFLCLNGIPLIQYAINACVEAGIKEVVFVYNDEINKKMYERYFAHNEELEQQLAQNGKQDLLNAIAQTTPKNIKFSFACQDEPKGNGDAVLRAKNIIGSRDFIVMWIDDVYFCPNKGILQQLLDVYEKRGGIVENIMQFPPEEIIRYGVLKGVSVHGHIVEAKGVVEKPKIEDIESDYASMGPYILPNKILDYLPKVQKGAGGEMNLTDALNLAAEDGVPFCGVLTESERYDCGTNEELAKANIRISIRKNKSLYDEAVKTIQELK